MAKKILLVDDDPDILGAMQTALADLGAELLTARDGDDALRQAGEHRPDVVVLDMMLPRRSGFLVLDKLKVKKKKGEKPFVIMITGNEGSRHKTYAETLGVDDYINKPFRMERLVESVRGLLEKP
jgi:DNA-binding response OmpR family regulator